MLAINPKHSNFRGWGDVRPTSIGLDNPSQWKIWTTHCGLWRTLSSGNEDEIINGLYMCPSNWPHGLSDDQPPPSPLALPLF